MFTQRTIRKKKEFNNVATANEALMVSLSEKAKVDINYMSKLTGISNEKIKERCKRVGYTSVYISH